MMTRYGASRVEKPVMPIMVGTCPTAILMADPVMKADRAVRGIRLTIQPQRARPMPVMMAPERMANAEAMVGPSATPLRSATTPPVTVDMTATG